MQMRPEWSQPQRQPGAAVFIVLHKVILQILKSLWPLFLIWLFRARRTGGNKTEVIILGFSVIIFIFSLLEYWYFRFSMRAGELIIKKRIICKKYRHPAITQNTGSAY